MDFRIRRRRRALEKIEIAALIGLRDVLLVERAEAALELRLGSLPRGAAARELGGAHLELQPARRHVELDQVAVLDQRQRAADPGFRREGVLLAAYDLRGRGQNVRPAEAAGFAGRLLDDLRARIQRTLDYAQSVPAASFEGAETREVAIPVPGREPLCFSGELFLKQFSLPNFLFHVTMTYALLRQAGVALGKLDYLGAP